MPIEVVGEMCEADKGSQWVGGVDPKCYLLCSDDDCNRLWITMDGSVVRYSLPEDGDSENGIK